LPGSCLTRAVGLFLVGTVFTACGGGGPTTARIAATQASPFTTSASGPVIVHTFFTPVKPCGPTVAPGTYSPAELSATQQRVIEATKGRFIGVGLGAATVDVMLMAGEESLAARISHTFGAMVTISVGLTNYCGEPGRSPVCAPMPSGNVLPKGLSLKLVVSHATIRSGGLGNGALVIHESGPGSFQMDTGQPITAELVRPGTRTVIGIFDGGIGGTGFGSKLDKGQGERIPVVFGAARCDGGLGSAVPPGRYVALVYAYHEEPGPGPLYYAPGVPVTVTPN
jgi:hypothetical protein